MARPKKVETDEMLSVINTFYEHCGDPSMLKYTALEKYALSIGANIKEYDLRRDKKVRQRIKELKESFILDSIGIVTFKNMDIGAMLARNRTREKLYTALQELNDFWRQVYEKASTLSVTNRNLLAEKLKLKGEIKNLVLNAEQAAIEMEQIRYKNNKLTAENRYLKRMLRQYLYPALANEILTNDNVLAETETEATVLAKDMLIFKKIPSSFTDSVSEDRKMISREDRLLMEMNNQITKEL